MRTSTPTLHLAATDVTAAISGSPPGALTRVRELFDREDAVGQFLRFVTVGVTSMLVQSLLFLALTAVGTQPANLVGSLASAIVANELHRRLTFHAGGRIHWLTAQLQGGGMSLAAILATSVTLAWIDTVLGATNAITHLLLIAAANGLVGLIRFAGLRWAFASRVPSAA